MKLLFDLKATQPAGETKRHGGGLYGEIVLKKIIEEGYSVVCFFDSKSWLNPDIQTLLRDKEIALYDLNKIKLDEIVANEKIDRIYSPFPRDLQKMNCSISVYGTIHGLRVFETPYDRNVFHYKNVSLKEKIKLLIKRLLPRYGYMNSYNYFNSVFRKSNFHPIAVSNHTANSIKVYFPYTINKVIPVFYSPSTTSSNTLSQKFFEKYYLIVSANRWEKNGLRAIQALDELISSNLIKDTKVYVTGAKSADVFSYKIKNPENFVFKGYVSDEELKQLYHDAYCLVYPTLNEGFGYPPIEAMRYGVPVVSSPYSSLTEVCGNAALYFNPFSVQEIMNRILQIEDVMFHKEQAILSLKRFEYIKKRQDEDLMRLIEFIYE